MYYSNGLCHVQLYLFNVDLNLSHISHCISLFIVTEANLTRFQNLPISGVICSFEVYDRLEDITLVCTNVLTIS